MEILKRWFRPDKKSSDLPKFGRFSDAYKTPDQYRAWDEADLALSKKNYLEALKLFHFYLKENNDASNATFEDDHVRFNLFQGSKRVEVAANATGLSAEAKVATTSKFQSGWMRRLLEYNYELDYCKYAVQDNRIYLKFDSPLTDLTAYKLFFALKELSIQSDKQDDLLIDDFDGMNAIDNGHVLEMPEAEKHEKFAFLQKKIDGFLSMITSTQFDLRHFQSAIGYLVLDLVYTLDYFITPQGPLMDILEKIHDTYFNMDLPDNGSKNQEAVRLLRQVKAMSYEQVNKELYRVTHTFGIVKPVSHDTVKALIEGETRNLLWYTKEGQDLFVEAICGYIVGFTLFSYAPPAPVRALFRLYYAIREEAFILKVGGETTYTKKGRLSRKNITQTIENIVEEYRHQFPRLSPQIGDLDYGSMALFGTSFLKMIHELDMTELEI